MLDVAATGTLTGGVADAKATGSFGVAAGTTATATVSGSAGHVQLSATANNIATKTAYSITFTNGGTGAAAAVTINTTTQDDHRCTWPATAPPLKPSPRSTGPATATTFNASAAATGALFGATASGASLGAAVSSGGNDNNHITLSASTVGSAYNGVNVTFSNTAANGSETASFDSTSDTLTVYKSATLEYEPGCLRHYRRRACSADFGRRG